MVAYHVDGSYASEGCSISHKICVIKRIVIEGGCLDFKLVKEGDKFLDIGHVDVVTHGVDLSDYLGYFALHFLPPSASKIQCGFHIHPENTLWI